MSQTPDFSKLKEIAEAKPYEYSESIGITFSESTNALSAAVMFVVTNLPTGLGFIIDQFQKLPAIIV